MNAVIFTNHLSIEDYLALEDKADFKSEYYAGEIYPMAGGTLNHNQIIINLCILFGLAFKKQAYRVFASDVKLHVPSSASFTYPDVLVINGKPSYWQDHKDIICNAEIIVEVLSDSTENYDKAGKFELYRSVPELHDYILISQNKIHVEHYVKQAAHQWLLTDYLQLDDALLLAQIEQTLSLRDIYDKVEL